MALLPIEQISSAVSDTNLPVYQAETYLGLFRAVPIPKGIATATWYRNYLEDTTKAALTKAGFHPNDIELNLKNYSLEVFAASQQMTLDEIQQAQYDEANLTIEIAPTIGKNVAYTANYWLFLGKKPDGGEAPVVQYNFISDASTANGTAARPLPFYDAVKTGVWGTIANMWTDLSNLIGGASAKGYNLSTCILMVPKIAMGTFKKRVASAGGDTSAYEYCILQGLRPEQIVEVDGEFMLTIVDGTTAPTAALFDIWLVDLDSIEIGYSRPERFRAIMGAGRDRNMYHEGEVWFCPVMKPLPKLVAGTLYFYKGMGRVSAIAYA